MQKSKKVFLVTVLQVSLVLMLAAIVFRPFAGEIAFYFLEAILSLIFLKILFADLRKEITQEYKFVVYFFAPLFALIHLSWLAQKFFGGTWGPHFFLAFILLVLAYLVFFKAVFGRNYTMGKVLLSNEKMAVVETDFDIRAFVTAGKHIVETKKKLSEGTNAKISVKMGFLGQKTSKVYYDD
ncbi:MAG: DUF2101 family protein [Candidatus Diapherotrites archaeon]|nr:DUF2101 family protein [Candidatus Diapherotrites archaeon]